MKPKTFHYTAVPISKQTDQDLRRFFEGVRTMVGARPDPQPDRLKADTPQVLVLHGEALIRR